MDMKPSCFRTMANPRRVGRFVTHALLIPCPQRRRQAVEAVYEARAQAADHKVHGEFGVGRSVQ